MNKKRKPSRGLVLFAVWNIFSGSLVILYALRYFFVPLDATVEELHPYYPCLMIAGGIGLLRLKPWARGMMIALNIVGVLGIFSPLFRLTIPLFDVLFDIAELIFLTRPSTAAQFE